jgi:fluoride exporter
VLNTLAIMIGGGLGAACRHWLFLLTQRPGLDFPLGTLAANLLGCLLVGLLWSLFETTRLTHEWRLFIFTGFLGGFTTYSTFARETTQLFEAGAWKTALVYLAASNLGGLALAAAGFLLGRHFLWLSR